MPWTPCTSAVLIRISTSAPISRGEFFHGLRVGQIQSAPARPAAAPSRSANRRGQFPGSGMARPYPTARRRRRWPARRPRRPPFVPSVTSTLRDLRVAGHFTQLAIVSHGRHLIDGEGQENPLAGFVEPRTDAYPAGSGRAAAMQMHDGRRSGIEPHQAEPPRQPLLESTDRCCDTAWSRRSIPRTPAARANASASG